MRLYPYYGHVLYSNCKNQEDYDNWPYGRTMMDTEVSPDAITIEEMREHMRRVETLCGFLEGMIKTLANNPMFAAMIPPEMLQEAKQL